MAKNKEEKTNVVRILTQRKIPCTVHSYEPEVRPDNVRDYGLSGKTEADGLACASPSSFVTRIMTNLVSGECTVSDAKLYDFLRLLVETEGERIEPSSCAAFQGPVALCQAEGSVAYCQEQGLTPDLLNNATQIVWATGGRLVPEEIWDVYLNTHLDA